MSNRGLFLLITLALCSATAHANIGETFGFGSRTASLAGAGAAWGFDGFAAYHNPAGLALRQLGSDGKEKRLLLNWGLLGMETRFTPINGVVVENKFTSDKTRSDSVDTSYRSTLGQVFGLSYVVAPEWHRLALGVTTYLPANQVVYLDTGETFEPEYFLYRARTQRPQVELGVGAEVHPGYYVGAGIHTGFSLTTDATAFLQTAPNKPSTLRFAGSLKPKFSPFLGFLYRSNSDLPDGDRPFTFGAVVRFPLSSTGFVNLKSGARAFGSLAAIDFIFSATSVPYYDPWSLELGGSYQYSEHSRVYAQLDTQLWSKFEIPALIVADPVQDCGTSPCGVKISGGRTPSFSFKNIIIPRIGHETDFGSFVLRIGYAFRPSILKSLPSDAGNYLDPSKHIFAVGVGFKYQHFLSFETPCSLDFHASYQALIGEKIQKSPGDENGDLGDVKIGAPGYDSGGKVFGGGLSLSLAF